MGINVNDYLAFVKSKVQTPYIYGCKGKDGIVTANKVSSLAAAYPKIFTQSYLQEINRQQIIGNKIACDCSGLVCWPLSVSYGSAQLYQKAYARLPMSGHVKFAPGTVLYRKGHVGIYIGNGLLVEAKGLKYGTVISKFNPSKWIAGLTFNQWIDYDNIIQPIDPAMINYKGKTGGNPYTVPEYIVKRGFRGDVVKFIQWELIEASYGYKFDYDGRTWSPVQIDGIFGPITEAAVKAFQQSCKITVDGEVGPETLGKLLEL